MSALGLQGQELTLKYIELYKSEPILWNTQDSNYKCITKRSYAWQRIQEQLQKHCSILFAINDLQAKRDCVMCSYRMNVKKIKEYAAKGEHFEPTWFAFDLMDSFLNQIYFDEDFRSIDSEKDTGNCKTKIEEVSVAGDPEDDDQMIEYLIEDEALLTAGNLAKIKKEDPQLKRKKIMPLSKKRPLSKINTSIIKNKRPDLYAKSKMKSLDEADECELYGRLLIKKLKRLSEKDRDLVMMEIDNIMFRTKMKVRDAKGENITS